MPSQLPALHPDSRRTLALPSCLILGGWGPRSSSADLSGPGSSGWATSASCFGSKGAATSLSYFLRRDSGWGRRSAPAIATEGAGAPRTR